MMPFDMVKYEMMSLPGVHVDLPAEHYSEACEYLTGRRSLEQLTDVVPLRRFLHHLVAFADVIGRFGLDWRDAAQTVGIRHLIDYFILQVCEVRLKPSCFCEQGERLAAIMRIYSRITELSDRIEHPAVTEAIQVDMGIKRLLAGGGLM